MYSALINCQEETANMNPFAHLAMELSEHVCCSSFHTTTDQLIILEFHKHSSGLFCVFSSEDVQFIWNSPNKFHNILLRNESVTHGQLKDKIISILL